MFHDDEQIPTESEGQPETQEPTEDPPQEEVTSESETLLDEGQEEDQLSYEGEESDEGLIDVDGNLLSLDELRQGYMRDADYRRKTQELGEQRKELKAMLEEAKGLKSTPQAPATNPQSAQIRDILKNHGVVMKGEMQKELEDKLQGILAAQKDQELFADFKTQAKPTDRQARAVRSLKKEHPNLSYEQIYRAYFLEGNASKKVVKRKVVGVKAKGSGVREARSAELTPEKIGQMSPEEYEKHRTQALKMLKNKK